jgi:hypothetical protein
MEGSVFDNIINCVVCSNKTEKYKCRQDKTNCLKVVINRLAELEDKIENGTLIELPCKVGQQVYVDGNTFYYYQGKTENISGKQFYVGEIMSFIINKRQFLMKIKIKNETTFYLGKTARYPISAIGKTVFLTKAEAEAKLKELQNER